MKTDIPIYALTVADMQSCSPNSQQRTMDGFAYLHRRGYTAFDLFTAHNCGAAIERGDAAGVLNEETDACYCEKAGAFDPSVNVLEELLAIN